MEALTVWRNQVPVTMGWPGDVTGANARASRGPAGPRDKVPA
jgi:hypothetical protein